MKGSRSYQDSASDGGCGLCVRGGGHGAEGRRGGTGMPRWWWWSLLVLPCQSAVSDPSRERELEELSVESPLFQLHF